MKRKKLALASAVIDSGVRALSESSATCARCASSGMETAISGHFATLHVAGAPPGQRTKFRVVPAGM